MCCCSSALQLVTKNHEMRPSYCSVQKDGIKQAYATGRINQVAFWCRCKRRDTVGNSLSLTFYCERDVFAFCFSSPCTQFPERELLDRVCFCICNFQKSRISSTCNLFVNPFYTG